MPLTPQQLESPSRSPRSWADKIIVRKVPKNTRCRCSFTWAAHYSYSLTKWATIQKVLLPWTQKSHDFALQCCCCLLYQMVFAALSLSTLPSKLPDHQGIAGMFTCSTSALSERTGPKTQRNSPFNSSTEDLCWRRKIQRTSHQFAFRPSICTHKFSIWMGALPLLHHLVPSRKCYLLYANVYIISIYIYSTEPSLPLQEAADISSLSSGTRGQATWVLLINCQLKSTELFEKSHYRVLPIRGLIHFPLKDCNIFTDFREWGGNCK